MQKYNKGIRTTMNKITIQPVTAPLHGEVELPGSKSLTNRAFALAALCDGEVTLSNLLASDDTRYMAEALQQLEIPISGTLDKGVLTVQGGLKRLPESCFAPLMLGNAGTAIRFLSAILALRGTRCTLTGIKRMQHRPIAELTDALHTLGAEIRCAENGCPPVTISGGELRGGTVSFSGRISSQYISAVMQIAPLTGQGVTITMPGKPVSLPYIQMTAALMKRFGAHADIRRSGAEIAIPGGQQYRATDYRIESDASSASYFFAAAAVSGGTVRINGLTFESLQGDIRFVHLLEEMGCTVTTGNDWIEVTGPLQLHGISADMEDISDTALTLAVTALFADGPTEINNVANMRLKETDRISALCTELQKLGAKVEERPDGLTIHPARQYRAAEIATYDDHRMAMSFAIAGLRISGVTILDPECTAKTFPDFFERLDRLTGKQGDKTE